ncbi:hypothetical protein Tco_1484173 [Tanacetum coccineum]
MHILLMTPPKAEKRHQNYKNVNETTQTKHHRLSIYAAVLVADLDGGGLVVAAVQISVVAVDGMADGMAAEE